MYISTTLADEGVIAPGFFVTVAALSASTHVLYRYDIAVVMKHSHVSNECFLLLFVINLAVNIYLKSCTSLNL